MAILQGTRASERVRFDCFEANLTAGELRKHGIRVKVYDQPFQILAMLIAHPGELITREEIQQKLWPSGTFVDFENGLNSAVNRLRDALGDSADEPKFIETVPRRGYRFIARVELVNGNMTPIVEAKPEPGIRRSKRWFWAAAASVTAVVALTSSLAWRVYYSPKKTLNFGARDWVLISSFENRTGNPVLDGTLEYALERELSNSQYVTVVSRERVGDVLRLMRKPPDTKIDAALGREICLRDGGIRAMLTGRVERLGTVYVLSAELVDPLRGVTVASLLEEDPADSQMAASVRRLSNRVRETLGEKTAQIQQSNERLEKVTTPSLHALQLYTQAERLMHIEEGQAPAAALLKQAIAEDPDFASAHVLLAYTYANREGDCNNPKCSAQLHENARLEFQRALDLANTTSDRERLFIVASHYDFEKNTRKAIETYEALLQLYPDHFWAANNLYGLYADSGFQDDSWRLALRLADLRPDDAYSNQTVACGKYLQKDFDGAKPYIDRVKAVAAADPTGSITPELANLLPVFKSWSEGNVMLAHQQLRDIEGAQKPPFSSPNLFFHLAFGEIADGERRNEGSEEDRSLQLGVIELLKGNLQSARKDFEKASGGFYGPAATGLVWFERVGLWNVVDRTIKESRADARGSQIVRGELALARGQTKEGIALLESGLEAMNDFPKGAFYLGSESLARAYEKRGDRDAALRILLRASNAKSKAYNCISASFGDHMMNGAWWLRDELQLADLYREMGRVPEAEKVEDELRKMLIYADADHPILRELQKRNSVTAGVSSK